MFLILTAKGDKTVQLDERLQSEKTNNASIELKYFKHSSTN